MKQILIAFLLILSVKEAGALGTDSTALWFNQANALLVDKQAGKALLLYRKIEQGGLKDAALYSNMSVCYQIMGQKGKALVYHERYMASEKLSGKTGLLTVLMMNTQRFFGLLCLLFLTCAATYFAYVMFDWEFLKGFHRLFVALLLMVCLLCLTSYSVRFLDREAVIIADRIKGRSGPSFKAFPSLEFIDAEKVTVVNGYLDWVKVKKAEGKAAWVEKRFIMSIVP